MLASKLVYINSEQRQAGSSSNFSFQMTIPQGVFDRVCVLQASIPQSYYIIENGINTFILRELGVDTTITIPAGNYNVFSMATAVSTLLTTASLNLWIYKMTYPNSFTESNTGKYEFSVTGNGVNQPSLKFTNEVHEQFGFELNKYYPFVSGGLKSSNVVSFVPETRLFIHSDIGINYDDGDTILQEIYGNNVMPLSVVSYQLTTDVSAYSKRIRSGLNNIYHFWVTNKNDDQIDLNGQDILITLLLYKRDNFTEVFKNFIQLQLLKQQQ
jgi:hypothetical protein